MRYCVNFYGVLLDVMEDKGIVLKTSFVRKCNSKSRDRFGYVLKKYWKGSRNKLKYKIPVLYSKFTPIFEKVQEISFGRVSSYGDISLAVFGNKKYSRLVGIAMKNNPLPIIIPCHRVVRSNGEVGGFSAGVDIKIKLLKLEKVELHNGRIKEEYFINL